MSDAYAAHEAERQVLGALMRDPGECGHVLPVLRPEDIDPGALIEAASVLAPDEG